MKWLASTILTTLATLSLLGCASDPGRSIAVAQGADIGSTAIGLSQGFAEANPLGLVVLPVKLSLAGWADDQPCTEAAKAEKIINSITYTAVGNNVALLAGINPAAGAAIGLTMFLSYRQGHPIDCLNIDYEDFLDQAELLNHYCSRAEIKRLYPQRMFERI